MATQTDDDAVALEYVAGLLSETDAIAMGVIQRKHDLAAWQKFCDHCEGIGEPLKPRALWLGMGFRAEPKEIDDATTHLAYGVPDWRSLPMGRWEPVISLSKEWAKPLIERTKKAKE